MTTAHVNGKSVTARLADAEAAKAARLLEHVTNVVIPSGET